MSNPRISDKQREAFTAAAIQLLEDNRHLLGRTWVDLDHPLMPSNDHRAQVALGSFRMNCKLGLLVVEHLGRKHMSYESKFCPEGINVFDGVSSEAGHIIDNILTLLDLKNR